MRHHPGLYEWQHDRSHRRGHRTGLRKSGHEQLRQPARFLRTRVYYEAVMTMTTRPLLLGLLLANLCACSGKDDSDETGALDDTLSTETGDTSTTETGDTSPPVEPETVTQGEAFCASGGVVRNDSFSGVTCTGPVEIATQTASNAQFTWQPGPMVVIAPASGLD